MKLLASLKLLKINKLPQKDFNKLIYHSISIALSFLKMKQSYRYFNLSDEVQTLNDVATEAIVPLFIKSKNQKLGIINSYELWLKPLTNDSEAEFFLNNLIMSRVEWIIPTKLKEKDPFFGKILNTISSTLTNEEFKKIFYLGTYYITNSNINKLMHPNIIPKEQFDCLPTELFTKRQKKLISSLLLYLENETEYFPLIPVNLLVNKIKNVMLAEIPSDSVSSQHIHETVFVKGLLEDSFKNIKYEIQKKYVDKNKLSIFEGDAIAKSFKFIIHDLINGGISGGLYSYLKEQIPNLSSNDFYSKYHGIMNYVYKNLKNEILQKWNH